MAKLGRTHYPSTGRRVRRIRPKTPPPKNGWLLEELAQLTGLRETTVRYYMNQHIIHRIELRGAATRYDRRDLLRLLGIMRLKREEESTLAEKKRKLDEMGNEGLERWLRTGVLPPGAAAALGFQAALRVQSNTESPAPALQLPAIVNPPGATATRAEGELERAIIGQWRRIALLPGLDLMLRADAKETARFAAQRICEEYVVK